MNNFKYIFSIIIPIYKVEKYLAETIDSVINQTIGFEKTTQIILVNDGSPDNCEEICLEYEKKYPNNIKYILQENAGVSAARNRGIPYVEGKYINFLDSDDKWDSKAFEHILEFFENHYNETDVVAARIKQFEASNSFHVLDYKFYRGTRVCDLHNCDEYDSLQLHVSSAFIKSEVLGDLRFDSRIKFGEDSLFINNVILNKMTLGVCKEARFLYRKRHDQSSAVQTQVMKKEYYFESPLNYYYPLINLSKEKFGEVTPYIQSLLAYDIGWRLGSEIPEGILSDEETQSYFGMLKNLYSYIDTSLILKNKVHKTANKKMTAIFLKNDSETFFEDMTFNSDEKALYYNDTRVVTFDKSFSPCVVHIAEIKNNILQIEGTVSKWVLNATANKPKLSFLVNGKVYDAEISDYPFRKENSIFGSKSSLHRFVLSIPIKDILCNGNKTVSLTPRLYFGDEFCDIIIGYGKFVSNYNTFLFASTNYKPYYIKCYKTHIKVVKPVFYALSSILNEAKHLLWLLSKKYKRALFTRVIYFILTFFLRGGKKIWLISDRSDKANDNGEAFFKYACNRNDKKIKPIFVINKDSEDVPRLKKIGKVIHFDNFLYPYYFLSADKIISSSGGEYTINPFGPINRKFLVDLIKSDYVFLQHGVIMNDLSAWLQKFNKNISMFVTSTTKEYNSIVGPSYLYNKDEVKLTGLARFDELENRNEKLIVVIPTWRRSIKESYDSETKSVYFDGFKETEYFKFYNSLINHPRLLDAMRKKGYKGLFCLHPIHNCQHIDYESNDVFDINSGFVNYKDIFSRSSLLITDYSSIAFDFAYLRKPIIYSQFDKEEFFGGQIYDQGYFSYDNDGMGPVCMDLESTIDETISLINNNCTIENTYKNRVDNLFAYNDKNNSERIYNEILEINKRNINN